MKWLAPFPHTVIRHVDDIIDGPHPRKSQAVLHPYWRWLDRDVLNETGRIPRAELGVLNLNIYIARRRFCWIPVR